MKGRGGAQNVENTGTSERRKVRSRTEETSNRRTTTVKSNGISRGALPQRDIMTRTGRRAVVDGLDIGRPQGCRGNGLGFHEPLAEPRQMQVLVKRNAEPSSVFNPSQVHRALPVRPLAWNVEVRGWGSVRIRRLT
jgi:hypothetical protein